MGFDGYFQILCRNGHLRHCDCYEDFDPKTWECRCGQRAGWYNLVDTTNGSYCPSWDEEKDQCCDPTYCDPDYPECRSGRIDGEVELQTLLEEETETCGCCGHVKVTKERIYKFPFSVGHVVDDLPEQPAEPPKNEYIVVKREVWVQGIRVSARNAEEAKRLAADGKGEVVDSLFEYSHELDPDLWTVDLCGDDA